ncbi:rhomboid family intramembrane serine protease [Stutzerimonas tarimensis]|uniref:Rhomboid family intramembrane serine protease n=1 Tax=Stutzerimonas tarimensis TaxID=1507735 RepID=A0ABV7T215_9GAMM
MMLEEAIRLPLSADLSGFVAMLQHQGVPCRVSEEAGDQVLRVPRERVGEVRELYLSHPQGQAGPAPARRSMPGNGVTQALRRHPFTSVVLLLTFIAAAVTWLGDNLDAVRWLSFLDFRIEGDYVYFARLEHTLGQGQWWRLITPVFIHFGFLHLAMNSLWYWELGRRIEIRQGPLLLFGLTLLYGLASNAAQYLYGGPGIFGGLSGVLYGLLGHCWLFQKLAPGDAYRLPSGVVMLMLAWLVICMTGLIEVVTFGSVAIANAAHVSGLVAGCITGVAGGMLARARMAPRH